MGRVVHFEIQADDPARAIVFYEKVFGWKITKWDPPGLDTMEGQVTSSYWLVMTGDRGSGIKGKENDGIDGAIVQRHGDSPPFNNPVSSFVCTIEVDDIGQACRRVIEGGGNMLVEKNAVPKVGWVCYCKDTEGNVFGMMQPDEKAK